MNLQSIKSYEDVAIDAVVSVINQAKEKLGDRQTLKQLASSRNFACRKAKVLLDDVVSPLAITGEKFIIHAIEKVWKLTKTFMYIVKYMGGSKDEVSQYYYFEAIFSQPTVSYPIPQATVSVFFRLEDKLIEPPERRPAPMMLYRIEGHHTEHDARYVALSDEWILAMIKMKIKLFKRIEEIRMF